MSDTQKNAPQENHHQLLLVALFALSMIALLLVAILFIAPEIEKDLNQKITEQLEKKGINASVSLSGRDVTLSGNVNSADIQKAEAATADVCGIHFIDNQLVASDTPNDETEITPIEKNTTSTVPVNTDNTPHTPSTKTEEKTATVPTTQSSSQAYEKILAAMSRYNEKQKTKPKDSVNSGTSFDKVPFEFDTASVQFKQSSNVLTSSSKKALTTLAGKLKKSTKTIEITVRSKKSKLAFEQAKKIQQYLIAQGIKKKRLIVIGKSGNTADTTVTITERKRSLEKK